MDTSLFDSNEFNSLQFLNGPCKRSDGEPLGNQEKSSNSSVDSTNTLSKPLFLRCNLKNDYARAEEAAFEEEKLNQCFLESFTQFTQSFSTNQKRPRQKRKDLLSNYNSHFVKYHEHLSQGVFRALYFPKQTSSLERGIEDDDAKCIEDKEGCLATKPFLYHQYCPDPEMYSRKVFIGGLPTDLDEEDLLTTFGRFGPLMVDWPNKLDTRNFCQPKGYVFLIFAHEMSVRLLCQACFLEDDKLLLYMTSTGSSDKTVQVRPWRVADADYVVQPNMRVDPRLAVFIGGVPRPIKAVELAHLMEKKYGPVACAGIDTDTEFKYPKGAGRVLFSNNNSFLKAITDQRALLKHGDIEKQVELKPYVLDDQPCDECLGERGPNGLHCAPFFCPSPYCLQYYCEECWTEMHSQLDFETHKPLVKESEMVIIFLLKK